MQDRLGLLHDRRHHVGHRADVVDEPRRLTGRRTAVLDVALLARANRRRLADALVLDGKGLDLGLAALPLASEGVPDLAVGLARHRASHHRTFFIDGRDPVLVIVVPVASRVAMKRVPIQTPAAPSASAATNPRPSARPPAATTRRGATASTTAGVSTTPPTRPVWPPPSWPCAMITSTSLAA